MKRVWINIITGKFSDSWHKDGPLDIKSPNCEEEFKEAASRGWKLIEYICVNDPNFELYSFMKLK